MGGREVVLDQVQFSYPELDLQFDIAFKAGVFAAIIGASGAGKSTLLNLVAGFEIATAGQVKIGDEDVTQLAPSRRAVSMVFQDHNLFGHLDVTTNIALGIAPTGRVDKQDQMRIDEALAKVGLAGFQTRLPSALSGGERQRVALARTLLRNKPVLLLDEPFAALGPAQRREMLGLMQSLHQQQGMTILMVTHQPEDARLAASHVAFVDGGGVAVYGETEAVLSAPNHPALKDYLGAWR